mmetsp:Transcript_14131/g.18446  ORF Transcript_14131/g.18446 Transcript_14131/m.18446 type:complete len:277 (+) Transcript_14131:36-866(+)|eukprot:CAMPEP_0117756668 /NCGR_PEP_ID=MMETSP0947-20121206/14228_1 /TAXON_ID=44440 /ORGANISM="Chattonella subsalsa, Strain CCMP2191" /LENGTH=276 /DNA_ID=CAMNT_0005576325 /DNA_START=25 /DNA_END=855 /DNA_ORIENTATION=-
MSKTDQIYSVFQRDQSLYDILEINKNASESQIKKAYFRMALKFHPDKNLDDESAKQKFQALSQIHSVLGDPEQRAVYDETGEVPDDDMETDDFKKWEEYWRQMFPKITLEDIDNFKGKYQGSEEEKKDVIAAYQKCDGRLQQVIDCIMLANEDDEDRFRDMIQQHIDAGNRENLPSLGNQAKGKKKRKGKNKKAEQEAKEAEEELARMIQNRHSAKNQITKRQQEFNDLVHDLEARYASSSKGKKGKKKAKKSVPPPDIDDAEFEALQARMFGPQK